MAELLKTTCTQGKLIITDTFIIIELRGFGTEFQSRNLARSSFSSLDSKMVIPSLFGLGGGTNLVFHGRGGEMLRADLVPRKAARKVAALLMGRG
jgi:hypothetical protein